MEKIKRLRQRFMQWGKGLFVSPIALAVILQLVTTAILLFHKSFYLTFLPETPGFADRAPLVKVCHLAMKSILDKNPSRVIFDEEIIPLIEGDRDKFFDFVGGEEFFDVMKKGKRCVAVITDNRGTRYFAFTFKDSDDWRHVYGRYIVQIDEILSHELGREK